MARWTRYTRKQYRKNNKINLKGMNLLSERKKKKYNKKYNILIVIAVIYIIYAIINLISTPTDVFVIEYGKVSLEESAIGYIIREETVVKSENSQKNLVSMKSEGEKVAKDEPIFRYYSSEEELVNQQIKEINQKLNEELKNHTELFPADAKALDRQIEQKIDGLSNNTDIEKIKEYKNDINTYLDKKVDIIGQNSEKDSNIKQLYEERTMYEEKLNQSTEYIKVPMSGVVSYRVDNLETVLTPNNFDSITKDLLEGLDIKVGQIVATSSQQGKVINNYECYIATIMNTEEALNSKERSGIKNTIIKQRRAKCYY